MSQAVAALPIRFPHVYVHLPFCESICHYCDFYVVRAREADHGRLFRALESHLALRERDLAGEVATIYFGGGTPSESPPEAIAALLGKFGQKITAHTEIVLEANPTSIDSEKLRAWRAAGITRLSIGTQSLRDQHLKRLGRVHNGAGALASVTEAAKVIGNVSADLIYGVPGMSDADAADDAAALAEAGAKHVSAYTLTLNPSHFLHAKLPGDEETLKQSEAVRAALAKRGLEAYEASNYAIPGFESRHNQAYWSSRPYFALGPSAHGYDGEAIRWRLIADWKKYCELVEGREEPIKSREILSLEQRKIEHILTRLRTRKGLNLKEFEGLYGNSWFEKNQRVFEDLARSGLGSWANDCWVPSFSGLMLADEVALKLV